MFYIHQTSCISPQQTFQDVDLNILHGPAEKKMQVLEPSYSGIPPGILRRMGKAVRMGVGAAMPIIQNNPAIAGIIMGTANAGKQDCVNFLNQVIEYDEGMLTPMNFVQSTPNAVAAQIALLTGNHGYNITHLHAGLAFEFVLEDVDIMLMEYPLNSYLIGGVDDISMHNYYFEEKRGWYKKEDISNKDLYASNSTGSIAGEAASMFFVNKKQDAAVAKLIAVDTLHNESAAAMKINLGNFIETYLPKGEKIDLLLTGENGDSRLDEYYAQCESLMNNSTTIARFKHMIGECPTASAMGLWLCCEILQKQIIPGHMLKKKGTGSSYKNVLIYNNYKKMQHSFILLALP